MKKQFFYSMLAAAAMMVSCTSDKIAENSAKNEYGLIEGQPAFITLGIAMPDGGNATRANDDVNDGIKAEYVVKSGRLVLFKGASEATATLWKEYNITDEIKKNVGEDDSDWVMEDGSAHITTTSKKFVQEIESPNLSSSEKLFAYVILNDKDNISISYTEGTTFETFSKTIFKAIGIVDESKGYGAQNTTNGFVMTSVPVCTAPGQSSDPSSGEIKTLTPIAATAVYPTKEAAEASTAAVACCYVERAAVKVQMTFNSEISDPANASNKITVENVAWGLGNVNSSATNSGYYNTRQVEASWSPLFNAQASYKYRFVSGTRLFATDHENGYRTYFGKDVNYDGNTGLIGGTMASWPLASGGVTYTYENTFDENSQIYRNTTYVGLKVVLNGGNDFYTIDGQNNTALNETNLKNKLADNAATQLAAQISAIKSTIDSKISAGTTYTLTPEVTLGEFNSATGKYNGYDVKLKMQVTAGQSQSEVEALIYEGTTTIATKLASNLTGYTKEVVNKYVGGVTYYATRIAHFGNTETPWNTESASYNKYSKIYPSDGQALGVTPSNYGTSRAAAWLGRWGIVRNNWYQITITNVKGIGDAVPVDYSGKGTGGDPDNPEVPGDTPDDNPEPKYYIAAHIHILPWCLRTQNVTL